MDFKNWKLKLRYGKIKTPFKHYTLLADGKVEKPLEEGFECPVGNAWMSMCVWAESIEEAQDMISVIGKEIGFGGIKKILVYDTEAKEPPRENPYGYNIKFTPYK